MPRSHQRSPYAEQYAQAIRYHAETGLHKTLYPAKIFEDLAQFLEPNVAFTWNRRDDLHQHPKEISHAVIHTLSRSGSHGREVFKDAESCANALHTDDNAQAPQILFLRGYSSPEWLMKIAGICHTDPEFLNSNMLYRCRQSYFSYPSLPSSYKDIIRLRVSTIGMREYASDRQSNSVTVQNLRLKAEKAMEKYLQNLASGYHVGLCDSIVRDYHVLDERYFVVEQEISVCLHSFGGSWLAWISHDSGKSLAEGVEGPWLSEAERSPTGPRTTQFLPIVQHGQWDWFRQNTVEDGEQTQAHCRYPQTAALLPLAYGASLNSTIMAYDPLYALAEVFRLCASSESQVLRLLETTIARDIDYKSLLEKKPTLSNLLYCREILSNHSERMIEVTHWIERYRIRHDLQRVVEDEHLRKETEAVTNDLLSDFEHLVRRADLLSKRCNTGMAVIGNNAMLDESRKAISQAGRVARLTVIASVFVPLSFTTSLFGMNVSQLGTGHVSLGVWAAVSSAVLFVTTLIFFVNRNMIANACSSVSSLFAHLHRRKRKSYDDSVLI